MNKEVKKILISLFLFSLAGGFFYNYQEMWLLSNNISISSISIIFSLAAIITISTLYLCASLVRKDKLKRFVTGLLLAKFIVMVLFFILNKTGINVIIKFLTLLEYTLDVEIYVSFYPLLASINKDDRVYAIQAVMYDGSYYIGCILSLLLVYRTIGFIHFSYNSFILIASLLYILSFIVLNKVNIDEKNKEKETLSYNELFKEIKKDKITKDYLLFKLFGSISFYSVNATVMIMLTEALHVPTKTSSFLIIVFGILSVILGFITMDKIKFKNDNINLGIKYIGRFLFYLLAFIFASKNFFIIAIIFCKLTVDSFIKASDSVFVNRISNKLQFSFSNFSNSLNYLGRAIGTFLCGLFLVIDVKYNFLLATIFAFIQIIFLFKARKSLNK